MALFLCRIVMHLLGHVSSQVGYSAPTQSGIIDEVGLSISEVCDDILLEKKCFFSTLPRSLNAIVVTEIYHV